MPTIPSGDKLIFTSASVDMKERKSAQINAKTHVYTMQDVADTVNAGGGGSSNDLEQADVTLTPAQMLSFNGGQTIEIIPASSKYISIIDILVSYTFNSVAYNFFGNIMTGDKLGFAFGSGAPTSDTTQFNSSSNKIFALNNVPNATSANEAFNLTSTSGVTVSQGDSTVKVSVLYRDITL